MAAGGVHGRGVRTYGGCARRQGLHAYQGGVCTVGGVRSCKESLHGCRGLHA